MLQVPVQVLRLQVLVPILQVLKLTPLQVQVELQVQLHTGAEAAGVLPLINPAAVVRWVAPR